MRILFDLQHPAHLHFFRNTIDRLEKEGHEILITGRDKDILVDLAMLYGYDIEIFGVARKGILNLGRELVYRQWKLNKIINKFKPDVMMAVAGSYISLLGKIKKIPTYVFYDTEHATVSNLLSYPFATCIFVPQCYRKKIKWNHVRYNGYHELAYLHPNYFTPDISVLDDVGLKPGELFTFIRLVGWGAGHDVGRSGLTTPNKIRAVNQFKQFGRVFISCEGDLPSELEDFRLTLQYDRVHHLMAYASMIFGESATMVSEGAVLGVPGVYIDPVGRGYTDEQQNKYRIVFNYTHKNQEEAIQKGISILSKYPGEKETWRAAGRQIVADKIDVTRFIYEIIMKNGCSSPMK